MLCKNDLYQQIYKMKEFQEQLYTKNVEINARIDQETFKSQKCADELQSGIDTHSVDIKKANTEIYIIRDLIANLGEAVCSIVELEAVASALEQQDEVDRKTWVNP